MKIEIGWVLVGRMEEVDVAAIRRARGRVLERMAGLFDSFDWSMPVTRRRGEAADVRAGVTVDLLDIGSAERDAHHWDAALVVTDDDLRAYHKPFALAAPSRALSVAALSTARLDPDAAGETDEATRVSVLARRLEALALHLIGHLLDVPHADDPYDAMAHLHGVADLDRVRGYGLRALEVLSRELRAVGDERLEERPEHLQLSSAKFYLRVLTHNRGDILRAVARIRPWEFPLRLSRLTTAAASTLFVLLMTAEAWDLGMAQPWWRVVVLTALVLAGGSAYVIRRQSLLVRRGHKVLSEQRAVGNWAIVIAVTLGMAVTWAVLVLAVVAVEAALYPAGLVEQWAASVGQIRPHHYVILAAFVGALGIVIGSLGAGFESQTYFRHVALVDEET